MSDEQQTTVNNETAAMTSSECMNQVAEAVSNVENDGPEWETRKTVFESTGLAVSRTVYASCYYLSFGIVFPTMLIVGMIPKENAIVHGLTDGAAAARDAMEKWNTQRAAVAGEPKSEPIGEPAQVAPSPA